MRKTKLVTVPPDGGWGWAVVFASFMIHVVADGVTYTFGLFIFDISSQLGASNSATAWIVSIMAGVTYGAGPFASAFVNRYGCRAVSISGSIIAGIGFGISYFATSVQYLYLSVGLVGGLGLGLMYLPAIVSVTCYFEKKRAFATGIAVCGSGFGTMVLAPIIKLLLVQLAWRGAFLVTSGIILNCNIFSLMLRPVKIIEIEDEDDDEEYHEQEPHNVSLQNDLQAQVPNTIDLSKVGEVAALSGITPVKYLYYPQTQTDNNTSSVISLASPDHLKTHSPEKISTLDVSSRNEAFVISSSQPVLAVGIGSTDSLHRFSGMQGKKLHSLKIGFQSSGNFSNGDVHSRHNRIYNSSATTHHGLILERKDVFYSGSLLKVPEFNLSNEQNISVDISPAPHLENNNAPVVQKNIILRCILCSPRFYKVLTTMLSISLLKNPVFLLFAISNFFTCVGYNVPYIYLVEMAEVNANPRKVESPEYLLSIVGISNTVSRIAFGYMSDKKCVNRLVVYSCAMTLSGLATISAPFTTSMNMLRVYSVMFGALVGVCVSLTSVILVDLLGLDKLTNAFGLLLLFQGIGTVIGPPIVGKLYDEFNDYRYGFGVAGGAIALSGFVLLIIPCIQKREKKQKLTSKTNSKQPFRDESLIPNSAIHNKKILTNNTNEDY